MKWLNTIRWKNLIIIWISILAVIFPYLHHILQLNLLGEFIRWGLICSSIAAIGNITNDWMDVKQDNENKKENIFIKPGKKKSAVILIAILIAISFVAILFSNNQSTFIILSSIAMLLLLLYNFIFKKIALVGNIIIAVLTAFIFLGIDIIVLNRVVFFGIGFENKQIEMLAAFAFVTTLIREILKDAEDRKGDLFARFNTIAKFLKDKWIAVLVVLVNIVGCIGIYYLMELRQANFMSAFIVYSIWITTVTLCSAILMLIPHPSRYIRATRVIKGGMLGCLVIYLLLSY